MPENTVKIVIDAEARKVDGSLQQTGDKIKKTGQEAAGVGKELDKWGASLAKTVVSVGTAAKVIAEINRSVVEAQRASADANRQTGNTALTRSVIAARLGISSGDAGTLTGAGSSKTTDELNSFLQSLVGLKGANGQQIDRAGIFKATALYRTGGYQAAEITTALEKGTFSGLAAGSGKRLAGLGSAANREIDVRAEENANTEASRDALDNGGADIRLGQSRRALRNANHPLVGRFQNIVGAATAKIGGDALIESYDTALNANTNALTRLALAGASGNPLAVLGAAFAPEVR